MSRPREFSREVRLRASLLGLGLAFCFIARRSGGDLTPVGGLAGAVAVYLYVSHLLDWEGSVLYRGALVTLEVVLVGLISGVAGTTVGLFLGVSGVALTALQYGSTLGSFYALLLAGGQLAYCFTSGWPPPSDWPAFFLRLTLPMWTSYLGSMGFSTDVVVERGAMKSQKSALDTAQVAARTEMEARRQREQELYEERRKLEALMEISHRMGVLRSPDELLATVVHCAKEQMQVHSAAVLLRRNEDLVVEWKDGITDAGAKHLRCKVGQGLLGQMVLSGQPFRFTMADNYAALRALPDVGSIANLLAGARASSSGPAPAKLDELRNFMAVPLKTPQEQLPFGLLFLANRVVGDSFSEHEQGYLQILATDAAIAIRNLFFLAELERSHYEMIQALAQAIEAKDSYTHGHVARVRTYSVKLARSMGLPADFVRDVDTAAILHDVGKISTPDHILMKPGALTNEEFEIMKQHASNSVKILRDISSVSQTVQKMVLHHHERWDGRGYPSGLRGNDIPLGAQIITVADCYDAMTSDRPYRKGFSAAEALKRMEEGAGSQFNMEVLSYFLALFNYEPKANPALLELTRKAWEKVGVNLMRSPEPSETRRDRSQQPAVPLGGGPLPGQGAGERKRLEMEL